MNGQGWIKLHRKTLKSEIFNDPDLYRLWSIALMKAAYRPYKMEIEGEIVILLPGQFVTGRTALTQEYNEGMAPKHHVKDTTLWSKLKKIEKLGNVKIDNAPSRKYSIVTICKWDEYQGADKEEEQKALPEPKEEDTEEMKEFLDMTGTEIAAEITPDIKKVDKPKKEKRVFTKEDREYQLSQRLFYWMLQNNPNAKKPNPQKWSDTFRLMIERDNRDPDEIDLVIDWSQKSSFWKTNILSADKLRKQYDTLYMQMRADQEKKGTPQKGGGGSRGERKNNLLREMMEEEENNNGSQGNNKTLFIDN